MDKGNLLASANGKGHKYIVGFWILGIIAAVIFVVLGIWSANEFGYSTKYNYSGSGLWITRSAATVKTGFYYVAMGFGIISGALFLDLAYFTGHRIKKISIDIYENVIEGLGVEQNFPFSSLQLIEFQLKYDQISSVDVVEENNLIINAVNVKHKILIMNAREIRDIILSQKNLLSQDTNSSKQPIGEK